ncbi:MAG: glycosyltransferase, partial [Actinomycetota bacterium]
RDLSRVEADVSFLPDWDHPSVFEAFRALRTVDAPGWRLEPVLAFLDRLTSHQKSTLLVHALLLASMAIEKGLVHLHAHFMTAGARTAYLAHLLTGIPFSVTAHAKDIYREPVDVEAFRAIARATTAMVTVCEANRRYITDRIIGPDGGRVECVYNGLPLDELRQPERPRDRKLVVAAGRLVEKKGFHILFQACRILADRGTDFDVVLLGEGEERERLTDLRSKLGLEEHVRMPGAVTREKILQCMSGARVLAAPGIVGGDQDRDALPTVLLESLALGLPVVSTPVVGVPEIVTDGVEGLLVPEGDPEALADAIGRLLADDTLWNRLALSGPQKAAERFDRRRTLPQLVEIFAESRRRQAAGIRGAG